MILNEKLFLNEKFGNIPNWLKSNLEYSSVYSIPDNWQKRELDMIYSKDRRGAIGRRSIDSGRVGKVKVKKLSDDEIRGILGYNKDAPLTDEERRRAYEQATRNLNYDTYNTTSGTIHKNKRYRDGKVKDSDKYDTDVKNDVYNTTVDYTDRYAKSVRYENEHYGLLNNLFKYGLDPSNLEVIEAPIPTSINDKHLKDPYIPVFLLVDKSGNKHYQQVYIKGINDEELNKTISGSKLNKQLRKVPMKDLIDPDNCARFAYIDTTNKNNWLDDSKLKQRDDYMDSLKLKKYYNNWDKIDKSGNLPSDINNRFDLYVLKANKLKDNIKYLSEKSESLLKRTRDLLKYLSWTDTDINIDNFIYLENVAREVKDIANFANKLLVVKDENDNSLPNNYEKEYRVLRPDPDDRRSVSGGYGSVAWDLRKYMADIHKYEKAINKLENSLKDEEEFGELDWE